MKFMKIDVSYVLQTDGDYSLQNPEEFGGTVTEFGKYAGHKVFVHKDPNRCKRAAKKFLSKFLCDGLPVLYTHHWLLNDFYELIDSLIDDLDEYESGDAVLTETLSGNYDDTFITITITDDCTQDNNQLKELRMV